MISWTNDRVALGDLKPWKDNPRQMTKRAAKQLLDSWRDYGQVQMIVIGPDNEVYDGHQRLSALSALYGPDHVVEVRRSSRALSDDERKRLVVLLHAGTVGQWDWDVLSGWDVASLKGWGMDEDLLSAWKRDVTALKDFLEEEDTPSDSDTEPQISKADELLAKWNVERGQLWQLGKHRLICGDSTDLQTVVRLMRNNKATIVFTDPPYGVSLGAKNRFLNAFDKSNRVLDDIENDDLNPAALQERLLPAFRIINERVMSDDCSVFVTAPPGGDLGMAMMLMMRDAGLPVRHVLVWVKHVATFSLGRIDYDYQHEPILFTWGKKHKRIMKGQHKTSVWPIDRPSASPDHPTMKPVALVENALLNHTDPGDICYDPFCGSGTAIIACENLGRSCCAVEIEPKYVAVALERWATHTGDSPVLADSENGEGND